MFLSKRLFPFLMVLALAGCGTSSTSSTGPTNSPTPGSVQTIKLTDFKVEVSPTLPAQNATFQITNDGGQVHELLVFKTDLDQTHLPAQASGDINEEGAGISKVSDGDNLDPTKSQTRMVDLTKPGKYLFVCNLPNHFMLGMYAYVKVT